jgi:integrase/recombinase XerD
MNTRNPVNDFILSRRSRGLAPSTVIWYTSMLGRFARAYKVLPEAPGAIEGFLGSIAGSDETRHGYYRAVSSFYRWTSRRQGFTNPITPDMAPRRRKKTLYYLTTAELSALLALPMPPRERAIISLLVDTGIRIGELLRLAREDVQEEYIIVDGKTGQREVPISEEARELLLSLVPKGHLFFGTKGQLGYTGAFHIVRKALRRVGVRTNKWGPHVLRHTFGRQYILAGGDLVSLQRILGHSNISTTRIYADLDLRDILVQHHKFSPLRGALAGAQSVLWTRSNTELPLVSRN